MDAAPRKTLIMVKRGCKDHRKKFLRERRNDHLAAFIINVKFVQMDCNRLLPIVIIAF